MRTLVTVGLVLLLSGFAAAQATVIGGTASSWPPPYGVYAAPFVPLVMTPEVTLETVSPSAVGASNATFGNVAGATNATLSMVNQPPVGVYTKPVFYGPSAASAAILTHPAPHEVHVEMHREMHGMEMPMHEHEARVFEYHVGSLQSGQGVARLIGGRPPVQKASRTFTNQDIDRMNQNTGNVKYDGKTEQIH